MEKTLEKGSKITFLKALPRKKKTGKKQQYGEVSFDAIRDKLEAKGIPVEKYLGYDFSKNWTEDQVIEEIEPEIEDEKPLIEINKEIVKKVNTRKRSKKKTLRHLVELDSREQGNKAHVLLLSKYERACHITNDNEIQEYLNDIHSTIILNDNEKKFNKRETIIEYLNDNFVWGIERASHNVAREYLSDDLFNEWNGEAFDLSVRNYVKSKEVWQGYRPYCEKKRFKPRQIATITEFNNYLNIHCPELDGVGKDKKIISSGLVSDDDSIDMKKRVKVKTFIRRRK